MAIKQPEDPISATSRAMEGTHPRTLGPAANFAHQRAASAAAVAADQAVDAASSAGVRRNTANTMTGKLGGGGIARRLAGGS